MQKHIKTIIILPTYNESQNLSELCGSIRTTLPQVHILIVDDNSPDGTGALADKLSQENPGEIFVLHRDSKEGLGKAYLAGFQYCLKMGYDRFVQMDADFSHPASLLPRMIEELEDYDFVLGSRYIPGGGIPNWNFFRRMLSKGGNIYAKILLKQNIADLTGGFKAFNRPVINYLLQRPISSAGYIFQIETTVRAIAAGFSYKELPFQFMERRKGVSKMSKKIILEGFIKVLQLRKELKTNSKQDTNPEPGDFTIPKTNTHSGF